MAVEVDNADISIDKGRDTAHIGVADGMISSQNNREDLALSNVGQRLGNLIERFLEVGGDDSDVACIHHLERAREIDTESGIIGAQILGRDLAHGCWSKAGTGTIRGAAVIGRPDDDHILIIELSHVLEKWNPEERLIRPGHAAREEAQLAISDALSGIEAKGAPCGVTLLIFGAFEGRGRLLGPMSLQIFRPNS